MNSIIPVNLKNFNIIISNTLKIWLSISHLDNKHASLLNLMLLCALFDAMIALIASILP